MSDEVSFPAQDGHIVEGTYFHADQQRGSALLVHGITADRHEWGYFDFLATALRSQGFDVLAIDYRGHGKSKIPIEALSLAGVFLDIAASWSWITRKTADAGYKGVVVGNSFGGGLSYLFGQMTPSVDTVVLTCPVTSYIADLTRVSPAWSSAGSDGLIPYASKRLATAVIPEMFAYDQMIRDYPAEKTTLLFHGTSDSDVPFSESEAFVSARPRVGRLHPLVGMDHSFSAPEGTPDRETVSKTYRERAALVISQAISVG